MDISGLNKLKSLLSNFPAKNIYFAPYFDGSINDFRPLLLKSSTTNGGFVRKVFQDLYSGKVISELYNEHQDLGHHFQDKNYINNGYNLKTLFTLKEASSMLASEQKELYTFKEIQILLSNFIRILQINDEDPEKKIGSKQQ